MAILTERQHIPMTMKELIFTLATALCYRNFQDVKLRQHDVDILQFAAIQILREIKYW